MTSERTYSLTWDLGGYSPIFSPHTKSFNFLQIRDGHTQKFVLEPTSLKALHGRPLAMPADHIRTILPCLTQSFTTFCTDTAL